MKKETPFLDFYYRCLSRRSIRLEIPAQDRLYGGLCCTGLGSSEIFKDYFDSVLMDGYWGYNGDKVYHAASYVRYGFTPLRQNIILLCAAINGEL